MNNSNLKVFFDVLTEVWNYLKITVSNQGHLGSVVPRPLPVIPAFTYSACPLCRSRLKSGATDVPKAHPCGSGSGSTSTALGSLTGPASVDHKAIPGRHG